MASREGWIRDAPGKYWQALELPNGQYAVGVIRQWSKGEWQAAATFHKTLGEAVEWIDKCLTWYNDNWWSVEYSELFDNHIEAEQVFIGYLLEMQAGELVS